MADLLPPPADPTIVLCYPLLERHLTWIQASWPTAKLINAGQESIASRLHEADIFVGHAKVPVDWDTAVAQGKLCFIQSSAAGLDHCLVPSVIASPITVCSASGLFANQVAEQTLALLLGVLRGLPIFFRQGLDREFVRRPTDDLHGKRVGIVGLGGNGRRLVPILGAFQATIRAVDYFAESKPDGVEELWNPDRLLELAAWSEILILTLPLNASTAKLISREVFESMPRGSYFINVARGGVVDERELIRALESGHLAAAGVDVTAVEPLPSNSPLWAMPNVIITPHVGAQAGSRVDDTTRLICWNLAAYRSGGCLLNLVDKRLGFPHPDRQAIIHQGWQRLYR